MRKKYWKYCCSVLLASSIAVTAGLSHVNGSDSEFTDDDVVAEMEEIVVDEEVIDEDEPEEEVVEVADVELDTIENLIEPMGSEEVDVADAIPVENESSSPSISAENENANENEDPNANSVNEASVNDNSDENSADNQQEISNKSSDETNKRMLTSNIPTLTDVNDNGGKDDFDVEPESNQNVEGESGNDANPDGETGNENLIADDGGLLPTNGNGNPDENNDENIPDIEDEPPTTDNNVDDVDQNENPIVADGNSPSTGGGTSQHSGSGSGNIPQNGGSESGNIPQNGDSQNDVTPPNSGGSTPAENSQPTGNDSPSDSPNGGSNNSSSSENMIFDGDTGVDSGHSEGNSSSSDTSGDVSSDPSSDVSGNTGNNSGTNTGGETTETLNENKSGDDKKVEPTQPILLNDNEDAVVEPSDNAVIPEDNITHIGRGTLPDFSDVKKDVSKYQGLNGIPPEYITANVSDGSLVKISGFKIDASKYPPADKGLNTLMIYEYCVDELGLNHAAACAVLANIQLESGFSPLALGDGGTSYGICQWHLGRFSSLMSFCTANNLDYNTVDGQLEYMKAEFSGGYSSTYAYLKSVPNTKQGAFDAAYYMCIHFEMPDMAVERGKQRGNLAANEYFDMDFMSHDSAWIRRKIDRAYIKYRKAYGYMTLEEEKEVLESIEVGDTVIADGRLQVLAKDEDDSGVMFTLDSGWELEVTGDTTETYYIPVQFERWNDIGEGYVSVYDVLSSVTHILYPQSSVEYLSTTMSQSVS